METKVCAKCGKELPVELFNKSNKTEDGYGNICKDCDIRTNGTRRVQVKYPDGNPLLKDFTPRELIAELRVRGYRGELTFVQKVKL